MPDDKPITRELRDEVIRLAQAPGVGPERIHARMRREGVGIGLDSIKTILGEAGIHEAPIALSAYTRPPQHTRDD